jgi:hypothetical protein
MAMCRGTVIPAGLEVGPPLVMGGESRTPGSYSTIVWSRPGPTLAIASLAPVRSAIACK